MSAVRKLMDDWKQDAHRHQEGEREARGSRVMASIQREYLSEATHEDEGLITTWTETLNILLTFAGLLSATITSFLIAVQPNLQPAPSDTTNKILMEILYRLDNTTTLSINDIGQDSSVNTVRVLAWWLASLACSLASAFGALVGKQWVLHYQSIPRWVNSPKRQCHVREGRYHGLRIWHFNTILGLLPVLLQTSLLLFAIGLADYLYPTKPLFLITAAAIGIVGMFSFASLFAGAFIPSCPFKTPVTDLVMDFISVIGVWGYALFYILPKLLARYWAFAQGRSQSAERKQLEDLKSKLKYYTSSAVRKTIGFKPGSERHFVEHPVVVVRLLCWRLQRGLGVDEPPMDGLEDAADALMAHPLGATMFYTRPSFWYWCAIVIQRLSREQPHGASCAVEADLLCHVIHHVPESKVAIVQATRYVMGKLAGEQPAIGFLANHLRRSWGMGTRGNLPVTVMRPASIAFYLQCQIYQWALTKPQHRLHRELLIDELPLVMERDYCPHDFKHTHHKAIINAITVTAIALVEHDVQGIYSVRTIYPLEPLEQLFQALHRLSHYPVDSPPMMLVVSAVKASRRILTSEDLRRDLLASPSWRSGRVAESLVRLLHIGRLWWYDEQDGWDKECPGSSMVHAAQDLIIFLAAATDGYQGAMSPWAYPSAVEDALASYAHPSAPYELPPSVTLPALQLLIQALRAHSRQVSSQYPPLPSVHSGESQKSTGSGHLPAATILRDYPQIVRQLIQAVHDSQRFSELQPLVLSAIIQGRHILFSPNHAQQSGGSPLLTILESLARDTNASGHAHGVVSLHACSSFNAWEYLLQELNDVERVFSSDV